MYDLHALNHLYHYENHETNKSYKCDGINNKLRI